jgi:multisubunit Na+/H+ antiporter MnhF subunit
VVEMVGIHQVMRFVMLESTKDRVIGVDTLGQ